MKHWRDVLALLVFLFLLWCVVSHAQPKNHPLVEKARIFLNKLPSTTAVHLRQNAKEFNTWRSLNVQQKLFREDLIWLNRGYTPTQIDLMVYIVIARSLQNEDDPKKQEACDAYRVRVMMMLRELSPKLEDLPNRVFRFHY